MTCKPFSSLARGKYRILVDADGTVRVWDAIAGHYTTCHSLGKRTMDRIRKMA